MYIYMLMEKSIGINRSHYLTMKYHLMIFNVSLFFNYFEYHLDLVREVALCRGWRLTPKLTTDQSAGSKYLWMAQSPKEHPENIFSSQGSGRDGQSIERARRENKQQQQKPSVFCAHELTTLVFACARSSRST